MRDTPPTVPVAPETEPVLIVPTEQMRVGAVGAIGLIALLSAGAASAALGWWGGQTQNWLVLLLGINSGAGGLTLEALRGVRIVDVTALTLAGVAFLGMRPLLGKAERVWTGIAAVLPFAGIVVLLATGLAGRSALMGAGLLLAWRMTKRDGLRILGWLGVVSNWLLLAADFSTSGTPDSAAADVVALSYVLLVMWLAWLSSRLLKPLRGRLVPVGVHSVATEGGGCRFGGTDTREVFDLPLSSPAEGALGTFVGVADETTRFTVDEADVTLMRFLTAYDEGDGPFEIRVEERGRLAAMTIRRSGSCEDEPERRPGPDGTVAGTDTAPEG